MIVILTGAYKNIGDHLIGQRAKKLLEKFVDDDIVELDRKDNLSRHIETINKSKALILCGGPAYSEKIYPNIYPLTNLNDIKVPIIPFGLGLSKDEMTTNNFHFTPKAQKFISLIHSKIKFSSCRDNMTQTMLNKIGINNVMMTGCPVWYELDKLERPFKTNNKMKKIVFTTPAKPLRLIQTIRLMSFARKKFPKSKLYCTFHRGLTHENKLKIDITISYFLMSFFARILNFEVLDVSKSLLDIEFYKDCDFHIGYRVHAHLFFLSNKIPSILINEDIRGKGMSEALKLPVFNFNDKNLFTNIDSFLNQNIANNFASYERINILFKTTFETMKTFLGTIK